MRTGRRSCRVARHCTDLTALVPSDGEAVVRCANGPMARGAAGLLQLRRTRDRLGYLLQAAAQAVKGDDCDLVVTRTDSRTSSTDVIGWEAVKPRHEFLPHL